MAWSNWLALKRLREAIQKVKFLLNHSLNRYRLYKSVLGRTLSRRKLSFPADMPTEAMGIIEVTVDDDIDGNSLPLPRSVSSGGSSDPDIDAKAEEFIKDFYRRLRIERQVSLELHYVNCQDLERTWSG